MDVLNIADFFARSLIPTIGDNASVRRVPFTFTSTQRLMSAGDGYVNTNRESAQQYAEMVRRRELQNIEFATSIAGTVGLSRPVSAASGILLPVISMMVNPSTIKWSQPKRYTKRDTIGGSVFYHFANEQGQNNDILTLRFSGNTGNISTQHGVDATTAVGGDLKLRMWHELYNLSREPMLLDGNIRNEFFITYRTVLMPQPITFVGFFDSVLEFTEDANKPFSRDYSFGFTVTDTSPKLDDLLSRLTSAISIVGPISSLR